MRTTYVVALGAGIAIALFLSVGTVYGITPWATPRQSAYPGGMMSGYVYRSGQQGGSTTYSGGMMGGYGGMMGGYGGMMSQYPNYTRNTTESGAFVAIFNYGFYPTSLIVSKGTTVTWVNMDLVQHTVTSGSEQAPTSLFDSHELSHMQSFSYTFNMPGTYTYFCDIHLDMVGTIIVK
jgi:plastocyanin